MGGNTRKLKFKDQVYMQNIRLFLLTPVIELNL